MALLKVEQIEKYYGNKSSLTKAIDDISFQVEKGEFVAVMGASGSGKTTLLNCISTIDRVTAGHIYLEGQDVTKLKGRALTRFRREKLGFIFQDFNLLDTLTAYENISLALSIQKRPAAEIDAEVKKTAEQLGITDVLEKYPYQMSGGQKQRVASARAIITDPSLVLADEPTGALDSKSSKMLLERFVDLNRSCSATIMMVTHDSFSASYAGRVIFIKDGKIFHEIARGTDSRKEFFDQIMNVVTLLGADVSADGAGMLGGHGKSHAGTDRNQTGAVPDAQEKDGAASAGSKEESVPHRDSVRETEGNGRGRF